MSSSDHFYEACHEAWCRGGNPDHIDPDRSENDYYDGRSPEYTASREVEKQQGERQRRRDMEQDEEHY